MARHATDMRTATAILRLDKAWITLESKDKATFDEKIPVFKVVAEKMRSDLLSKAANGMSMEKWCQFLNICIVTGSKKDTWQAQIVKDIKAQKGLRHNSLVRIDKKVAKLGAPDTIKAVAATAFPHSEYFNKK